MAPAAPEPPRLDRGRSGCPPRASSRPTPGSSGARASACGRSGPGLPDALDLLAVGTAAGRSPLAGSRELGAGEGPLAGELAMLSAEAPAALPQSEALESLRARGPRCGRSRRCAACSSARAATARRSPISSASRRRPCAASSGAGSRSSAARAAPKIQLAVALVLVPSVLLMIAAGLLANIDRFMAGF